ncbi:2-polyprenyl-6-methoxyphenol hydroxylase-like oxidoreductase [Mycobacterium sp. 1100029.7]|nr:2-polyprenyl-6-methoxyphenol hydroxylase-like oxidoreductase [Mycobacterium sp. 1100029.7]
MNRDTAIVLGASVTGLLAARVLADFYDSVLIIERDVLPNGPQTRRGVPQGGMPHIPAARLTRTLAQFFPGFLDELVASGARVWDDGDLSRLCINFGGHQLLRSGHVPDPESIVIHYAHRPFLEWRLRRRVAALANVDILQGRVAMRLTSTRDRGRVTGVVVARGDSGAETACETDLVVDTTGRGSRTPLFLEELGYGRPREDQLKVNVTYAGLPVYVEPGRLRENSTLIAAQPDRPLAFAMTAGENDVHMLAVQTLAGQPAPSDRATVLDCLEGLAPPHVLTAVRSAEPLADVTRYKFPANRWRRYDKMARTPDGLIVMGDAVCSFNPLYGQGMSVAAGEARILHDWLARGDAQSPRRFFGLCANTIGVAWQTAVASDLALPQIAGNRTVAVRVRNALVARMVTAAQSDPVMAQRFLRMMNMVGPRAELIRPSTMLRMVG